MSWILTALMLVIASGESPSAMNERALELLEQESFDEAISLLEQAVEKSAKDQVIVRNLAVAWNNRGLAHLREGRYGAAIQDFEAALKTDEGNALFLVHLGYAYLLGRNHPRAEAILLDARGRHPAEPKVYDFLGFLYYSEDRLEKAIEAYENRLRLEPDDWAASQLDRARREFAVSGDYVDRSSNDFTLKFLGSDANYAIADELLVLLEDARARVCSDLGHFPSVRTTVLLYSDQDFKRATGAHEWIGGLYDGKIRLPVRDFRRQKGALARTARHEYTHRVLADLVPACPIWVNEGLAEWFESEGDGAHDDVRAIAQGGAKIPSFAAMPKTFANESDAGKVRVQYAASRSFIAFLRGRYGLGAIRSFVLTLGRGEELDGALRKSFGYDLEDLEALWRREILS